MNNEEKALVKYGALLGCKAIWQPKQQFPFNLAKFLRYDRFAPHFENG